MRKLDAAYINGKIYTVDEQFSTAAAFGVSDDRFAIVGSNEEVLAHCTSDTPVIDLKGQVVLPGLTDAHLHIAGTGALKLELNIVGKQKQEILDMVAEACKTVQPGEWIVGRGWINDEWEDAAFPSKEELDAVAPDTPVYLKRGCGHGAWVNSKAFETVGITDETPSPVGGEIMKKPDGTLLGIVTDQAQDPFNKAIPPYTHDQIQRIALLAQEGFFQVGITSVHDAGSFDYWVDAWEELYQQKKLKMRMYVSLRIVGRPSYEELLEGSKRFFEKGMRIGAYDNRLTYRAYKISGDGSLGSRSAWMLDDYSDAPGNRGCGKWSDEELYNLLYPAHRAGFQIWYHGIGDAACRQALNCFERLQAEWPRPDCRHRIEHSQCLSPDDMDRYKELGVIPTYQTVFLRTDKRVAEARWGKERMKGAYAWRTMIDKGNVLPNGTDSPVESFNPFVSMYCAVSRKDEHGQPEGGWYPEQAMTREEAVRSYTSWAAYGAFEEHIKGSIQQGKLADFIVIDRDIMTCPESEIKDIQVLRTVVGGETVYTK